MLWTINTIASPCAALVLSVAVLTASQIAGVAQEKDSTDHDYTDELPRIKASSPTEALRSFHVAKGFRIEQVASEPLVVDPIAMAFDENGRLFVIEMRGYSEDGEKNLGRVRLLVDEDEDGHFEKSTVYADGLSWPTAITCYDGGVFVGAAPDIYYLKDDDGDGKSDNRVKVFSGFGRGNVQGLLNTFKWGLDNRIHGATSSSGATVVQLQPANSSGESQQSLPLRGRDFAIEPKSLKMTPTSGGGQHGLSFNQWGEKFVCSNSNHIQYVKFEDRYVARNPFFAAPSPRISIATDGPQADVFRSSPVEPWRIVRTRLRVKGIVRGPVEGGGTPAGYFTGATGVTIYRGNAWPKPFYGWAIIGDVGSNLIHRKRLERQGIGYRAYRVDEKSEFVTSDDIWFRPVQFANAPDGTLYVADMSREVIEHPKSLPPVIKKHLDLTSGRDRGRIYRIVPEGFQQPAVQKLGKASTAKLVSTLDHANGWHRETAARLLFEQQDRKAVPLLEKLLSQASRPEGMIRALYVLDGLGELSPEAVLAGLSEGHARVREHAVRLSERIAGDSPQVRQKLYSLANDPDLRVRYQLAFTLGELRGQQRNETLALLLMKPDADSDMRTAVFSSLAEGAGAVLKALVTTEKTVDVDKSTIQAIAKQIGRQQRPDDIADVLSILRSLKQGDRELMEAIVEGLAAKPGTPLHRQIAAATSGRANELIKEIVAKASQDALDENLNLKKRVNAVHQLRLGSFEATTAVFDTLLSSTQPTTLQSATLDALATFESKKVGELLVSHWPELTPSLRRQAENVLFSRKQWIPALLEAVKGGEVKLADLDPGRIRLLAIYPDANIRRMATSVAAELLANSDRAKIIESNRDVLNMSGDAKRGQAVFRKVCAACHKMEGLGHEIGPNLAAMRNRGAEAILVNLLDPNREVNPQYLNYTVITSDGRTLSGMVAAETATSIQLRRAEDKTDTVLRIDIEAMKSTGMSLMPEGLEKQIDKQALADLLEYLRRFE